MTQPIKLRIGDRTVWIVRPGDVESWSVELAGRVLREAADEWAARESLLRLSDTLHGPERGIDAAVGFLADALERGTLLAVRLADGVVGVSGLGDGAEVWDDAPRLSDLADDPADARKDGPGGTEPGRGRPAVPEPWRGGGGGADVVDPGASFVAFAVFDQHGNAMRGASECAVDGGRHSHALEGAVIEIRPIGQHATIELVLAGLEQTDATAAAT